MIYKPGTIVLFTDPDKKEGTVMGIILRKVKEQDQYWFWFNDNIGNERPHFMDNLKHKTIIPPTKLSRFMAKILR